MGMFTNVPAILGVSIALMEVGYAVITYVFLKQLPLH